MKPVVIRNIKRADSSAVGTLHAVGVSTAHEALRTFRADEALYAP